ncbi:MAG: hypothetical protein COA79_26480 [Planctomycetota bacterium]|nr:MAG: hypothetical protein COA79_26480 [Planctomycetota bacterium]
MKHIILFLILIIPFGCGAKTSWAHTQKEEIQKALLEATSHDIDPYIIIEDPTTKHFVQFIHKKGKLSYSLPDINIGADNRKRSIQFHKTMNIKYIKTTSTDAITEKKFEFSEWSHEFKKSDLDKATNLAIGVFYKIYGHKENIKLNIIKGWQ